MTVSRRSLLKSLAALGASGAVTRVVAGEGTAAAAPAPAAAPTGTAATEAAWRAEFAATYGDGEQHGYAYHCVNCQGNCAWEVWTDRDGKITRENQSARYPAIAADIPDANPRGCNKGVQQSQVLYQADRLLHPMRRVGARGEGKWKRISWDEAITEVATRLYETMLEKGPAGNYVHMGSGMLSEARAASVKRLGTLLGAVRPYIASYVGDMFPGVSAVYGEGNLGCTYDFIYGADVALFWGCNPNTSRIPDAHYLWEAKYRGAKVIVITPEFNATAVHADLWVPVKPGGDGHLALAIIHRLLTQKRYPEPFLKKFTDLPLLVRTDTRELVRLAEVDLGRPALRPGLGGPLRRRRGEVARGVPGLGRAARQGHRAARLRGVHRRHPAAGGHRLEDRPGPDRPPPAQAQGARRGGGGPRLRALRRGAGRLLGGEGAAPHRRPPLGGGHPGPRAVRVADRGHHPRLRGGQALQRHALAAGHLLAGRLPRPARPHRRPQHRERVEHQRPGGALRVRRPVQPPLRLRLRLRVHDGRRRRRPVLRRRRREAGHRPRAGPPTGSRWPARWPSARGTPGPARASPGGRRPTPSCSSPTPASAATRGPTATPSSRRPGSSPTATSA